MTGAEFERLLQQRDGFLKCVDAGERAVQFDAFLARLAGDEDAGEFVTGGDHQVGKGFVIEQPRVVLRLDVLDQPVLGQQGFDFAVGLDDVEIDDIVQQAGLLELELGGGLEIAADPIAQGGRLADIDDAAFVILHQVDAGRFRQGLGFVGEFFEALVHE